MNTVLYPKARSYNQQSQFYWIIPSTINLPHILTQHPPDFSYKLDHFYYLLDVICNKMDYLDPDDESLWVYLNAKKLQMFNSKYNCYLKYLKQQKIIVSNDRYEPGKRSKGFRITQTYYSGTPICIDVKDYVVRKKLKQSGWKTRYTTMPVVPGYEHLSKWFNSKLKINVNGSLSEVEKLYPEGSKWKIIWKGGRYRRKNLHISKFKALRAIEKFSLQQFTCKVDGNIGRFHSNLTCMKKELRNYVTYDGQTLVNLDISNSQPFFSGVLLMEEFYRGGENSYNLSNIQLPHSLLSKQINSILYSIMLSKTPESLAWIEFQQYLDIVQAGNFYENLAEILNLKHLKRSALKELTFQLFFVDNRHRPNNNEKVFKSTFPEITSIFSTIKRHDNSLLSHILQRIESEVVVERATRRIALEKPELPIFTIHDSIATTLGNEDYVQAVLKEEITNLTGLNPCIGREYWAPSNETIEQAA